MKKTVNKFRGETSIEFKGKTRVLKLSVNAICDAENMLGRSIGEILLSLEGSKAKIITLRALLWAALNGGGWDCTVDKAGDVMSELGLKETGAALGEVIKVTFPDADEKADEEGNDLAVLKKAGKTS